MGSRRVGSPAQGSFLETLLLGASTEPTPIELPHALPMTPKENPQPSTVPPAPDEIADLFGFISALAQTKSNAASNNATQEMECCEAINPEKERHHIAPERLCEQYPEHLAKIVVISNLMRKCEGLPLLEKDERKLALQLMHHFNGSSTKPEVEASFLHCCRDLETLALRLYGDVAHQEREETSRYVDVLMQIALRQPYEDEEAWTRTLMEAAVRKVLAGQSNHIYSALILSTLQRPFREVVRQMLQANELPFQERVLALAREKGYANTIRTSFQTLARLGLTSQTAALAWEAARGGQTDSATPWIARRVDGCAAVILDGYAIVDQRVIRYPGYDLLAIFDAERRVTHQMTIAIAGIEEAKQSLWAQGYHHDDEGFPLPSRVVQLWSDFCHGRDNGWWFGDQAGRVLVVTPYVMRRRLAYHKPLCRAVAQMHALGYRFRVDDHTLYFLPAGVDMPVGAQIPNKEIQTTIEI